MEVIVDLVPLCAILWLHKTSYIEIKKETTLIDKRISDVVESRDNFIRSSRRDLVVDHESGSDNSDILDKSELIDSSINEDSSVNRSDSDMSLASSTGSRLSSVVS
jgi:hypothetical protein